jgi:hypothetical protein
VGEINALGSLHNQQTIKAVARSTAPSAHSLRQPSSA